MDSVAMRSATVLVFDTNPEEGTEIRGLLENCGHKVRLYANGTMPIDAVKDEPSDLVILDGGLDEEQGGIVRHLRELRGHDEYAALPVVVCSRNGDIDFFLDCAEAGASAFILKPFDAECFSERIRRLLHTDTP